MPPITELTRIEPIHLQRLAHQGIFTTGLLLEVSETAARRQTLADQVVATTNDVLAWRDEALLLNLAGFGAAEHDLFRYAGFDGLALPPGRRPGHVPGRAGPRGRAAAGRAAERPDGRDVVGAGPDARGRVSGTGAAAHRADAPGGASPGVAVAVATALVIAGAAIALFFNPAWVSFAQGRADAAAYTGWTAAQVDAVTRDIVLEVWLGPGTFEQEVAGEPVFDERERVAHGRRARRRPRVLRPGGGRPRRSCSSPGSRRGARRGSGAPSRSGRRSWPSARSPSGRAFLALLRHRVHALPPALLRRGDAGPSTRRPTVSSSSSRTSSGRRPRSRSRSSGSLLAIGALGAGARGWRGRAGTSRPGARRRRRRSPVAP